MKKTSFVLAVLAASTSAAWAQSNVTIYGIVDGGVQWVDGTRGGSRTNLVSGIMDGSRIGFRGTEDLGGGYKTIFTLENRTEIDTGSLSNRPVTGSQMPDRISNAALMNLSLVPGAQTAVNAVSASLATNSFGVNLSNAFFDRQAYVGLITPVGAVLAGRQYTPAYEVNATYDIMNTQSSLSAGQVAAFPPAVDIRLSNSVQYRIQAAGVTASLMGALGEGSTTGPGRFYGGMVQYKNEAFSAGFGYNTRENENGQKSLTTSNFGASATFGISTISAMYGVIKDDNPAGLSTIGATVSPIVGGAANGALVQNAFIEAIRQDARFYHLGYKAVFGPNTVYTAYSLLDDQRPNNADTESFGVGYTYSFSKRSDLNFIVTHFENKGLGQALPGQAGFLGGVTDVAGKDANSIALGLRHRF
jgi:predicted porin